MSFFAVLVLILLVVALNDATNRAEAAERQVQRPVYPQPQPVAQTQVINQPEPIHESIVTAFDVEEYMTKNNLKAFFCSHENRIYWVKESEEIMFCPQDSTLLYAC